MLSLLMLVAVPAVVRGHGGMVWPPIWQDARGVSVDNYVTGNVGSNPMVRDPATGRRINYVKSWLTDQAYTGGHGPEARGTGPATNPTCPAWARKLRYPWAAPGRAPNLGGGCGIHGGNPLGCPAGNDTRDPHSNPNCGQPGFSKGRGTWAFGSSALDIEFPQALTTEWKLGSRQKVAWLSGGGHRGGYTYRLCKMPAQGKKGLTEECFARTVLPWASKTTLTRPLAKAAKQKSDWTTYKQKDVSVGTYPEGSAWRPVGPHYENPGLVRMDWVRVPADLQVGEYVLSFRWDSMDMQVWVSCANVKIIS
jgi:hypothetical protein